MRCATSLTQADITRHYQSRNNIRSRAASTANVTSHVLSGSVADLSDLPVPRYLASSSSNLSKIPLRVNGQALAVYSKGYRSCFMNHRWLFCSRAFFRIFFLFFSQFLTFESTSENMIPGCFHLGS